MYFNGLKRLRQDLDIFLDYTWKKVDDCNHYKKMVKNNLIFKFLTGVNIEFDEVRGKMIGQQPLPPIGEAF